MPATSSDRPMSLAAVALGLISGFQAFEAVLALAGIRWRCWQMAVTR